jgi:CRISPR-associated protein Cas2
MRTLYLVLYDICLAARLTKVRNYLTAYKVSGQKSVFECWFTQKEFEKAQADLLLMIDQEKDRLVMIQLDPRQEVKTLGIAETFNGKFFSIV